MIVPEIQPAELGAGYLIRLGNINGYLSMKATVNILRKTYVSSDLEKTKLPSMAILLSRALGISTEQYCRFHTLLPVLRSVSSYLPYVRHGDIGQPEILKYHTRILIHRELKVCSRCVHEDIEYHGFTYFRREHQLPGFDFCSKHHRRLVRSDCNLQVSPDHVSTFQGVDTSEEYTYDMEHKVILRYRTIIDSWASAKMPIPNLHLIDLLQSKAKSLDLRWSKKGKKRLLSDLVIDALPKDWLEGLIPNITNKNNGEFFSMIDALLKPNKKSSRSCLYALALSILFDSAEDALNASYDCIQSEPRVITKKNRVDDDIWRSKDLHHMYIESRGNATALAEKLGLSSSSVSENLNKNGLLTMGNINKKEQLAFLDFQSGLGLMESCLKHEIELKNLEKMLRISSSIQAEAVRSIITIDHTV